MNNLHSAAPTAEELHFGTRQELHCQKVQFKETVIQKEGSLTFSFLRALNLRKHSTVSWRCIMDATVDRCWKSNRQVCEVPIIDSPSLISVLSP